VGGGRAAHTEDVQRQECHRGEQHESVVHRAAL
jgi:hypothetical protein